MRRKIQYLWGTVDPNLEISGTENRRIVRNLDATLLFSAEEINEKKYCDISV